MLYGIKKGEMTMKITDLIADLYDVIDNCGDLDVDYEEIGTVMHIKIDLHNPNRYKERLNESK